MLRLSLLLMAVVPFIDGGTTSEPFVIRHKLSGKYIHPHGSNNYIPNDDPLVIFQGQNDLIYMEFEIVDDEYGYIRHINSGKLFHPLHGEYVPMYPPDDTDAVLYDDEQPWALFALDQVNNHILHRGGKYLHPRGGWPVPGDETHVVLYGGVHEAMEFELVNPYDTSEIVYPYGDAKITADWTLVFSVENPLATHTETISVTIGKSVADSTSSSFQFGWEASATAQISFAKMSTSVSLSTEISQSSTETWHAEFTKTDSVQVVAGETVAVWQRHYIGEQLGHVAFHRSSMFADTNDVNVKPGENGDTIKYRHI